MYPSTYDVENKYKIKVSKRKILESIKIFKIIYNLCT